MRILFFFALVTLISCAPKSKDAKTIDGLKLFKMNCSVCHGIDGKLQSNGSKDLSLSDLSKAERLLVVRKGKGAMAAFEKVLNPKEIEAVVEFTLSLKTN